MFAWRELGNFGIFKELYFGYRLKRAYKRLTPTVSLSERSLFSGNLSVNYNQNDYGRLYALSNSGKGKRVFLIASGSSLKRLDLSKLKNENIVCVNSSYKILDKHGIIPNYLLLEDVKTTYSLRKEINNLKGMTKLIAIHNSFCISHDSQTIYFKTNYLPDGRYWDLSPRPFSKQFHEISFLGGGILYLALQFIYHLGFDDVYLLGVDHGYGKAFESKHINNKGKSVLLDYEDIQLLKTAYSVNDYLPFTVGQPVNILDFELLNKSFFSAKENFENDGRHIYNAGVGSNLDIFPFVDFESLFN